MWGRMLLLAHAQSQLAAVGLWLAMICAGAVAILSGNVQVMMPVRWSRSQRSAEPRPQVMCAWASCSIMPSPSAIMPARTSSPASRFLKNPMRHSYTDGEPGAYQDHPGWPEVSASDVRWPVAANRRRQPRVQRLW